ncbi:DnaD domain-containing protein [Oceanobacillus salinisoli]|uniref:DnaD domain-containing protein n=1 Tax=Oceanobacillus salinisoli TaxID=2678611 RepID=UPI0012E201C7|nr:DnaD domain protein [Oceanobacillus salinisoli]
MNYIKQLNAFKEYLEFHDIPSAAILLWHTLMMINNMAGWKHRFNASNALVRQYGGLSKQRLSEARAVLVKYGLIHYEPGAKGRSPVYEMVVLDQSWNQGNVKEVDISGRQKEGGERTGASEDSYQYPDKLHYESVDTLTKSSTEQLPDPSFDQLPDESRTILKQKQKRRRGEASPDPFTFYNQNFSALRPASRKVIASWCDASDARLVLEAMQVAVMHGGRTLKYIERILNEWSRAGLSDLDQVRSFVKEKESMQERKWSVPFWKKVQSENKSVLHKLKEEMLS